MLALAGTAVAWHFSRPQAALPDAVDNSTTPDAVAATGTTSLRHARRQYNALLALDEHSRKEADQWIFNAPIEEAGGPPNFNNLLSLRMEHRLKMVKREYQAFITAHPRFKAVREAYDSFVDGMNEKITAVKELEHIRQVDPNDGSGWSGLAHYYSHNSPVEGVFKCYEKAIEVDSKSSINYENLATAIFLFRTDALTYYHLKNEQEVFDRALEVYSQAQAVSPEDYELASDIAESYYVIKPNRVEDAIGAWQTVLKLAGSEDQREEVYLHLARFEIHAGRFDEARQYLGRVSEEAMLGHKETIMRNLLEKETLARHPISAPLPPSKS